MLPKRSSFHPDYPAVQFAWDSTSLSKYMECPTLYAYTIVLGYRPRSASIDLSFGSIVHKGLEIYWTQRFGGAIHDDAQKFTVAHLLVHYHSWKTDDTTKNLYNAIRSVVWHTEAFHASHDETLALEGTPGIELAFKYDLGFDIYGIPVAYCGHMDRVIRDPAAEGIWVVDYKTTKHALDQKYFSQFSPSTQLPGYLVGSTVVLHQPILGVRIDGIQVGVNFSRFNKGHIFLGESQRDEWMKDTVYYIKNASRIFHNASVEEDIDLNLVPRNTQSCFGCNFRRVCSLPPSLRRAELAASYDVAFWDPILRKEAL